MFNLTIDTSNAAFDDNMVEEMHRVLSMAAADVLDGKTVGSLYDSNGNKVGSYELGGA